MAVIVLDPNRPDEVPVAAIGLLQGPVVYTEEVPIKVVWDLPDATSVLAPDVTLDGSTLLTADRSHLLAKERISRGEKVIESAKPSGSALLEAVAVMDVLRSRGPWEQQQTHKSLRKYLVEETYEVLDAIDTGDMQHLCEELSDLLLQVLFHARIAADDRALGFDIDDVAEAFTRKMRHRAPGVLSGADIDLQTQIEQWEANKAEEKKRPSVLDGITRGQPALALAQQVVERMQAAGVSVDDIPAEITQVTVVPGGENAEDELRRRVLEFVDVYDTVMPPMQASPAD
jgi:XTP/dITP diphosphohydrolase